MDSRAVLTLFVLSSILLFKDNVCVAYKKTVTQPHVLFILADDLGFNDVSYNGRNHGSAMKTTTIDKLAAEGVTLGNYYVQPICTPTRSQLMSGRYQIHTGLYHRNFYPDRPQCLPLDEITFPQKMKDSGYATHMIGKWHLGFHKKECLPTYRGFDTFLGYYLGSEGYFNHNRSDSVEGIKMNGYDFHRDVGENLTPAWEYNGQYSTFVFTQEAQNILRQHKPTDKPIFLYLPYQAVHEPMEVPEQYTEPFKDKIKDKTRLQLAGIVSCMDEGIANITQTLKETGLYDNTIMIFSTDNGGPTILHYNNWPLRGAKGTLWEGGVHGVGFVHSPLLPAQVQGTVNKAFIHVSDWFPTIVQSIAGGQLNGTKPLDGYDVWDSIIKGTSSPRKELLHNIDPYFVKVTNITQLPSPFTPNIHAALRVGDWKILTGNPGVYNGWIPPLESGIVPIQPVMPEGKNIWLFNITADPDEKYDVAYKNPSVVKMMLAKLAEYYNTTVPVLWPDPDPNCDPANHGGVWGPWM
ncbi:arylsulfatase J-like isoform X2 [Amphiura filiformis]|uniref:arylsulfatase J-like isoform X2 n=1 Tax=Amphiura filiformis TaxID=82378 RepID=UPI003B216900